MGKKNVLLCNIFCIIACSNLLRTYMKRIKVRYCLLIILLLSTVALPNVAQARPSVQSLMARADSCRQEWQYNKALSFFQQAYNDPSVASNPELQMHLLARIMRTHYVLRHWKQLPETSYQLYILAKKHNAPAYVSMALFMRGKRFHMEGEKEKGYQTCLDAVERMKNTDFPDKNHELAAYYAILAKMYSEDGRYEDALRMSDEQGRYAHMEHEDHSNCQRGIYRYYGIRLDLMAKLGRHAEADSLFRLYGNAPITDPLCGDALFEYFKMRGNTDACLRFIDAALQNITEDGDTIGRNMQRLIRDEGDIYYRLGQYQQAAEAYAHMGRIADSISVNTLRIVADEVYKAIDNEHAIARHRQMLIIAISGAVLLLTVLALLARQGYMARRKNRSMMNAIQQLMRYRDQVVQNGDSVKMDENDEEKTLEEEYRRFKEVDKRIMKERLFTQPDFGREELMRLLGVDKNTLPSLIQRYAGTNVPGYVSNKRMEYAVQLMKQHPEYTLGAISEACGIKSPATFIRNFKNTFGMTPSEFQKNMTELPSPTDF